jgi:hypothetical protein
MCKAKGEICTAKAFTPTGVAPFFIHRCLLLMLQVGMYAPSNGHLPIPLFKLWLLYMTQPIGKLPARLPFSFTGKQTPLNPLLKECFLESLPRRSFNFFQICKTSEYLITEKTQNLQIALYPLEKVHHPGARWNLLNWLGLPMSATHFSISARP